MFGGTAGEVLPDKLCIGHGVDGKTCAVATHAHVANHDVPWSQVAILIVVDDDGAIGGIFSARQVTGGARNTRSWRSLAGSLCGPGLVMRGAIVVARVFVGVAIGARTCGSHARVVCMRRVA